MNLLTSIGEAYWNYVTTPSPFRAGASREQVPGSVAPELMFFLSWTAKVLPGSLSVGTTYF